MEDVHVPVLGLIRRSLEDALRDAVGYSTRYSLSDSTYMDSKRAVYDATEGAVSRVADNATLDIRVTTSRQINYSVDGITHDGPARAFHDVRETTVWATHSTVRDELLDIFKKIDLEKDDDEVERIDPLIPDIMIKVTRKQVALGLETHADNATRDVLVEQVYSVALKAVHNSTHNPIMSAVSRCTLDYRLKYNAR